MVTFANLGSVRLPSFKLVRRPSRSEDTAHLVCQLSIYNSFPVIRTATAKKSPFSRTAAHIFVSPGDAPAIITQYVSWMERQYNACQTPRSMYLSIFNSFRGAITLNIVWMEREFDAYKLSRCMCPSNYNRF